MTTIPDKAGTTGTGQDKKIGTLVLNLILVILSVATLVPPFHCVAGIFLLVGCGVHVALHGHWIKAVILGMPKNATPAFHRQRRLFWAKLLSGFLCGLSGLVGLPLQFCVSPIHVLSGLAFFSLNIYHLVLHRNWFRKNLAIFLSTPR